MMPQSDASESSSTHHSDRSIGSSRSASNPNVLKRFQACHQCRKRKLKCDAKRPCSTCVRSYAHAVAHMSKGVEVPPKLDCTFDTVLEANPIDADAPKNQYDTLESRINKLETLLYQNRRGNDYDSNSPPQFDSWSQSLDRQCSDLQVSSSSLSHMLPDNNGQSDSARLTGFPHSKQNLTVTATALSSPPKSSDIEAIFFDHQFLPTFDLTGVDNFVNEETFSFNNQLEHPIREEVPVPSGPSPELEIIWPNWPPNLPPPDLLRHLVEVFFAFQHHARRLFHTSSFMASLSLPPSDPRFPIAPVLHAICSVSPMYTAAVSSPPLPNYARQAPDEIFQEKHRLKERRPESFAEEHARRAKETIDVYISMGEQPVQVMQANVILSWYFWCHAKWVETWTCSGHSLRMALPLGLNKCPPFHSISVERVIDTLLPPPESAVEDEMRRNLFWLAYATDRTTGMGTGWASGIDDNDVGQFLPLRGDLFDIGALSPPTERQWAHTKDLLLVHPVDECDSFSLYIKGTFLITRVKNFNHRIRSRHYAENPSALQFDFTPASDARNTQAFKELDNILLSFRKSFPHHLKNFINGNVVDLHLYAASLFPLVCTILLHEPHADVRKSGCMSALRLLTAARDILDLIYALQSTSYDITLMDFSCTLAWLMSGRVLARFLQLALKCDNQEQISTLSTELAFVQLSINKVGERIPLAYSHAKILHDYTVQTCGTSFEFSRA